ncbi:MAG: hypothetical protein LUF85_02370 [Bacteroides sp.]|nr:hypothetical protein [Bacteroides sp.]
MKRTKNFLLLVGLFCFIAYLPANTVNKQSSAELDYQVEVEGADAINCGITVIFREEMRGYLKILVVSQYPVRTLVGVNIKFRHGRDHTITENFTIYLTRGQQEASTTYNIDMYYSYEVVDVKCDAEGDGYYNYYIWEIQE